MLIGKFKNAKAIFEGHLRDLERVD